jgi:predicted transcriptional regulator
MAVDILTVYLANNAVPSEQLPRLIERVKAAISGAGPHETPAEAPAVEHQTPDSRPIEPTSRLTPAVPVEESVRDDCLISLEDGKPYRSLRRHLMAKYNMTPDEYRQKWGLSADYPMVAPSYARERSEIAKRIGLGHATPTEPSGRSPPRVQRRA